MNEVTIDMSFLGSPESEQRLISKKVSDVSESAVLIDAINKIENESTQDTEENYSQVTDQKFQTLPKQNPDDIYICDILAHLKRQEDKLSVKRETIKTKVKHEITSSLRAKMVDWIIQVVCKAECSTKTLCLTVDIIDRFLNNSSQSYKSGDIHIIGVVAMLLASKFEDVIYMDVQFMYEQVVHKKISIKEIIDFESKVFEELGHYISAPTEMDFIEAYAEELSENSVINEAQRSAVLNLHSPEILSIRSSLRAAASVLLATKKNKESSIDVKKLCSVSGFGEKELNTACKKIQDFEAKFTETFPKLKSAVSYYQ